MHDPIERLSRLDVSKILIPGDPHFKIDSVKKSLELLTIGAKKLLGYPNYWAEIPKNAKFIVINEVTTLMRIIDEIKGYSGDAAWLRDHLDDRKESISNLYDTLYQYLVTGINSYESRIDSRREELNSIIEETRKNQEIVRESARSVKNSEKQAVSAQNLAKESATDTATNNLSTFFDKLSNGEETHTFLGLAQIFRSGYKYSATRWFIATLFFIGLTAWLGYISFHDFKGEQINQVLAKALILAAPAYGIKFSAKNFRYNKSLETANNHRAVVMKTLLALMSHQAIEKNVKQKIIVEAVSETFKAKDSEGLIPSENESVVGIPEIKFSK